eukprot:CAMPEP_0116080876 /NCGR_PEP_ID=MMETSP0327-20121206/1907_1 /TAXON_ID=44447 /ORGANISM="Pseudo-nitzschia delicatissima, Strain B596" /LENGTH=484 /DNA_ID=CAMNT_0003571593 /DNA_START=296 /DNA_END=1751 /DNA_ORIENTATION=-
MQFSNAVDCNNNIGATAPTTPYQYSVHAASTSDESAENESTKRSSTYDLGVGKNLPVGSSVNEEVNENDENAVQSGDVDKEKIHWQVPDHPNSKTINESLKKSIAGTYSVAPSQNTEPRRVRRMVARTEESSTLRGAIWHEEHYSVDDNRDEEGTPPSTSMFSPALNSNNTDTMEQDNGSSPPPNGEEVEGPFKRPDLFYPNIDLSIPPSIYNPDTSLDVVWDLMRWEAYQEAQREPLLVSFLYSSILNHNSLESSLAFLLANKLSSAAMISTQVQSLILDALDKDRSIGRAIRADIMAVRDRDPACTSLPDVFLYFKGFHALQTYRVAHAIWKTDNKQVLAHYLQSQMSQTFQIDIHPNATLGSGIMLDHGTGIVIGETSHLGHNCSILHHVTLGGSGKKGVDRHPKVGDGVLLGAGSSVLGNVKIGDGCQVGAGGLVITDLPPHSVAVGVPVKIIGSFVDVTEQPSVEMNQMMNQTYFSEGI